MARYGDKRDYPKIDLYIGSQYVATTTWSKTLKQAREEFIKLDPQAAVSHERVRAEFQKRVKR